MAIVIQASKFIQQMGMQLYTILTPMLIPPSTPLYTTLAHTVTTETTPTITVAYFSEVDSVEEVALAEELVMDLAVTLEEEVTPTVGIEVL